MSKEKKIYEAIDVGDNPDHINPSSRAKIEGGELGYEDMLHGGVSDTERYASTQYQGVVDRVRKYFKITDRRGKSLLSKIGNAMGLINDIKKIESSKKEILEHLALHTVLNMPMFEKAKEMYEEDELDIEVTLLDSPHGAQQMMRNGEQGWQEEERFEDDSFDDLGFDDEDKIEIDFNVVEDALDSAKKVRRMQNIMIQGAAIDNMYIFEQIKDDLDRIDPGLTELYGKAQSSMDMYIWMAGESTGSMPMGIEEIEFGEENQKVKIVAKALIFPLLVHEIIKGLMEYVTAKSLPEDEDIQKKVFSTVDTHQNERFDMMLGPAIWREFKAAVGKENENLIIDVWNKIINLPNNLDEDLGGGFVEMIKAMTKNPESAREVIRPLVEETLQEIRNYKKQLAEYERSLNQRQETQEDDDDDQYGLFGGWKDSQPDVDMDGPDNSDDDDWDISDLRDSYNNPNAEDILKENKTFRNLALSALLATSTADAANTPQINKTKTVQVVNNEKETNQNIIARTIWREALAEGSTGMRAVASVIYNRNGGDISRMIRDIKKKKRFSCWNKMTPEDWDNFKIKDYDEYPTWRTANKIAKEIVDKKFSPTVVHDHYYNPDEVTPYWADDKYIETNQTVDIGNHRFIKMKGK